MFWAFCHCCPNFVFLSADLVNGCLFDVDPLIYIIIKNE